MGKKQPQFHTALGTKSIMLKVLSAIVVCATILNIDTVNSASPSCPWMLKVDHGPDGYRVGAHFHINEIYQNYYARAGSVNGKSHWISEDEKFAIWFHGGNWHIGTVKNKGREPYSPIAVRTSMNDCPDQGAHRAWQYKLGENMMPAGDNLKIEWQF